MSTFRNIDGSIFSEPTTQGPSCLCAVPHSTTNGMIIGYNHSIQRMLSGDVDGKVCINELRMVVLLLCVLISS